MESGRDLVTLLEDTEKLRIEVKMKDALLVQNEEANNIGKLEWIVKNLEKQLEGVTPEFEREHSQMMNNIYKILKYIKIPEDLPGAFSEPNPEEATEKVEEEQLAGDATDGAEDTEEQQPTPEPEPGDLESLLSYLKTLAEAPSAISMFEDKPFVEEDLSLAAQLFQDCPPFLLSQLLGLTLDQWGTIEIAEMEDLDRQRRVVLRTWGEQRGEAAKWSLLVEALIVMGLRGKAQTACIEKGVPLPDVSEKGSLWPSVKETLLSGSEAVKQLFAETERVCAEVKRRNEELCGKETQLDHVRTQTHHASANLKRAKQGLAREMSQCKALEAQMEQASRDQSDELFPGDNPVDEAKMSELKSQHKQHMDAVQSLWKEREEFRAEHESLKEQLEPQEREMKETWAEFDQQRKWMVARLEEMYDLVTGREKPVPKEGPPPPKPARPPLPSPPALVPPSSITPGGYRAARDHLVPITDPVAPTGYTIMDLFHPSNVFSLLPAIDPVGRPLAVSGNKFTGIALKGRGSLMQECGLVSEVVAPFVVTLRIPNRGHLMVDDDRRVSINNSLYLVGNAAFEFTVRPYKDTKVTFESRKFLNSFLAVDQNAYISVQEMPPDSSEVQFVVRVHKFVGPYTRQIVCPYGKRPSVANQLKDRSVIQLYSKSTGIYLGLSVNGDIVAKDSPDNDRTFLVYCDRGLGRVSLQSYTPPLLKIKMRFNGSLISQGGEENLDNDFYLKESPDGTVLFESVSNKGQYVQITMKSKTRVTIIRNFNIALLVFNRERGKLTRYLLN